MRIWFMVLLAIGLTVAVPQNVGHFSVVASDVKSVQVPIPMECRVKNRSGIQCVWCSIECLGRYHRIKAVMHLTDKHTTTTSEFPVRQVLNDLGVKYLMNPTGNRENKRFLKDACVKGWGAAVGLSGVHMINVVHFKEGKVKVIDNSDPSLKIKTWTEGEFMSRWDGWAITLIPPSRPGDGISQRPKRRVSPKPLLLVPRPPSAIR